ncbi:hypothetical protein Dimus_000707 [Dionaea muscipula]
MKDNEKKELEAPLEDEVLVDVENQDTTLISSTMEEEEEKLLEARMKEEEGELEKKTEEAPCLDDTQFTPGEVEASGIDRARWVQAMMGCGQGGWLHTMVANRWSLRSFANDDDGGRFPAPRIAAAHFAAAHVVAVFRSAPATPPPKSTAAA